MTLQLHGYWRSTAAYRVRMALNFKGVAYDQATHDLRTGAHRRADYLAIAPQGLVPAVEDAGLVLTQSLAILEWIEERWPEPTLLPGDPDGRALVRAMAALVACDIHPLNNLRVLKALRETFAASEVQVKAWISRWIDQGFGALDAMIARHGGPFAHGQHPSLADCVILPQVYSAQRFAIALEPYPNVRRAAAAAAALPPFAAAHPDLQPDADAK